MEPKLRKRIHYETESGNSLFEKWFDSLENLRVKAMIRVRLDCVALGLLGDYRDVGEGVWELRIDFGPGHRIYYSQWKGYIILLLLGGTKKSQSQISRPLKNTILILGGEMLKDARSYDNYLIYSLKDPKEASSYLQAALENENKKVFLTALKNVALAFGGIRDLSKKANLNRESLYRTLSKKGNPELKTIHAILEVLGFEMKIVPKRSVKKAA